MPPNDDVFTEPAPAAPAAPPAPPPAYVTAGEFKEAMGSFAAELREAITASVPQPAPVKPASADDWQAEFFQSPRDTIRKEINDGTSQTVALFARSQAETMLEMEREKYDSEWGPGAWDLIVAKPLQGAVEDSLRNNPLQLVSKDAIKNSIATLTGRAGNVDKLIANREAHRSKTATEREAEETARMERFKKELPGLTGGVRLTVAGNPDALDDTGKEFIKHYFTKTGENLNERELLASLNSGSSYDEWKAAHTKATKAAGAK
jgi:hypothetical protein